MDQRHKSPVGGDTPSQRIKIAGLKRGRVRSNVAAIKYIDSQEAHHRKISFEDEFVALLKKHGVRFDPKYVFG